MRSYSVATLIRPLLLAAAISQLFALNAFAGTEAQRIADLEKKLAQSMEMIEKLAARVKQLEQTPATQASAPTVASTNNTNVSADQNARIETLERNISQMVEANARSSSNAQGLAMHGFADVGYGSSGRSTTDTRHSGFALGNLDFYLTPEFGDRVKSLIELTFEFNQFDGTLGTDIERMQIGYTLSDAMTIWAGRFHTPYGYWNTAFHHGAQIQTTVMRPRMIAFEDSGGFMPSHTVGLWLTGQNKMGDGKVEYDAYFGNGQRDLNGVLDFNAVKDDNGNKIVGGSLRYKFGGSAEGLVLGTHAFSERVNAYADGNFINSAKVNVWGLYGFYDADDWEIISEYYRFNNTNESGVNSGSSHKSTAGFLQVGKNINGYTPYFRYEKADLDQSDYYFGTLNSGRSYQREVIGLRYDLSPKAAVKVEFNRTDETRDGGEKYNEGYLQYAVRF